MRVVNYFLFLAVIVGSSTFGGFAHAKHRSELEVSLKSDCAEYEINDVIMVSVALKNRTDSPITLYSKLGWGDLGGLVLRVSRMNNEILPQENLDHDMIVPSTLEKREYYSTLFRNQFIGISRTERVREFFPTPGKYKIWAEYLSPVPAVSSPIKDQFWSTEKGRVTSNVVVITVANNAKCENTHTSE